VAQERHGLVALSVGEVDASRLLRPSLITWAQAAKLLHAEEAYEAEPFEVGPAKVARIDGFLEPAKSRQVVSKPAGGIGHLPENE